MTDDLDDDPEVIDKLPGSTLPQTTKPVIVRMKEGIGDFLGFTPLAWNDPIFDGVFGGNGLNQGAKYRKVLGGYKDASYQCIAETDFTITETFKDGDGLTTSVQSSFKTFNIGFPKGHSVNEVISWLATSVNFGQIAAIRGPSGYRQDLYTP
jgi:predicted RNA-binding protein with TRAM domain